jgi:hypothetical protein
MDHWGAHLMYRNDGKQFWAVYTQKVLEELSRNLRAV